MNPLIYGGAVGTSYDPTMTLREARACYFQNNGFGEDGGYGAAWVDFKLGSVPMPFPNTKERVRAVRYHDLHHILTDYRTDTLGEFEISAWEITAGCRDFWAAWVLNLAGVAAGSLVCPRRTYRAFAYGLGTRSLYGEDLEVQLARTVGEVRAERLPAGTIPSGVTVAARFLGTVVVGVATIIALTVLVVALVPFGVLAGWLRKRKVRA
ncbi:MAG: hypothetical protein RMJ98_20695 [Myxococcales bacterium]|nr:hypothetical protein [Polyangiaceae bacterium]MDW8251722.1 hypothetical protein [Myxococcales bacterium]